MKLPDKFYQNLILFLLAVLVAGLLAPFVFQPQVARKANLSELLVKGPSINEATNYVPLLIKWLFAFLVGFATVKWCESWQTVDHHESVSPELKKYQETLNTILSLKEKTAPPQFKKRKTIRKTKRKPTCFSRQQAKKIIDSSRSLSKFKVKQK